MEIIDNDKMEVLKSKEYKELEKLAECLEMVVGWVEEECGRIKKRIGERKWNKIKEKKMKWEYVRWLIYYYDYIIIYLIYINLYLIYI